MEMEGNYLLHVVNRLLKEHLSSDYQEDENFSFSQVNWNGLSRFVFYHSLLSYVCIKSKEVDVYRLEEILKTGTVKELVQFLEPYLVKEREISISDFI